MRQLKGKVKETRKQRKERRQENVEIQNKMKTVVLPAMVTLAMMVIMFIYLKTRPAMAN